MTAYQPPTLRPITDPVELARIDRALIVDLRAKLRAAEAVLTSVRAEIDRLDAEAAELRRLTAARRGRGAED